MVYYIDTDHVEAIWEDKSIHLFLNYDYIETLPFDPPSHELPMKYIYRLACEMHKRETI